MQTTTAPPLAYRPTRTRARDVFENTLKLLVVNPSQTLPFAGAMFALNMIGLALVYAVVFDPEFDAVGITLVVLAVLSFLGASVTGVALERVFLASANGVSNSNSEVILGTVKRLPALWSYFLVFAALAILAIAGPIALAVTVHPAFLSLIAGSIVLIIAASSYMFVLNSLLVLGPKQRMEGRLKAVFELTQGRWGLIFRMGFMINLLANISGSLGSGFVAFGGLLGIAGLLGGTSLSMSVQGFMYSAAFAASHHHLDLPTDPQLAAPDRPLTSGTLGPQPPAPIVPPPPAFPPPPVMPPPPLQPNPPPPSWPPRNL